MKNKILKLCLFVALVVTLMLPLVAVSAQDQNPPVTTTEVITTSPPLFPDAFKDITSLLNWVVTPIGIFFVAELLSHLLDKSAWWRDKVPHDLKVVIPVVLSAGLAYGALWLKDLTVFVNDPFLNTVFLGLIGYWSMKKQHDRFDASSAK